MFFKIISCTAEHHINCSMFVSFEGRGWGLEGFGIFTFYSQCVLTKFPRGSHKCSQRIPNVHLKMFPSTAFSSHLPCPKIVLIFTYIVGPEYKGTLYRNLQIRNFYFGEPPKSQFFLCDRPIKMAHCFSLGFKLGSHCHLNNSKIKKYTLE